MEIQDEAKMMAAEMAQLRAENAALRRLLAQGATAAVAGTGFAAYSDVPASPLPLNSPTGPGAHESPWPWEGPLPSAQVARYSRQVGSAHRGYARQLHLENTACEFKMCMRSCREKLIIYDSKLKY